LGCRRGHSGDAVASALDTINWLGLFSVQRIAPGPTFTGTRQGLRRQVRPLSVLQENFPDVKEVMSIVRATVRDLLAEEPALTLRQPQGLVLHMRK